MIRTLKALVAVVALLVLTGACVVEVCAQILTFRRITRTSSATTPACASLPAPWSDTEIGTGQVVGDACYSVSSSQFTVTGSDILAGTSDHGHWAYQSTSGDKQIVAEIVSGPNGNVSAGGQFCSLMVRPDPTDVDKPFFRVAIDGNRDALAGYRLTEGASSGLDDAGVSTATWARLRVESGVADASWSTDGTTWIPFGSTRDLSAVLSGTYYLGLVADNIDDTELTSCTFGNVTVEAADTGEEDDFGCVIPELPQGNAGCTTSAGRGGAIYFVDTLTWTTAQSSCSGTCSGNATTSICDSVTCFHGGMGPALDASGARYILPTVSGYMEPSADHFVNNGNLTVAMQTAPSPGVTIRYHGLQVNASDALFMHLRIRPGWTGANCNSAFQVWDYGGHPTNIVVAYGSFSWSQDEQLAFPASSTDAKVSIFRTIVAEGLFFPSGSSGCTGGGANPGHGIASGVGQSLSIIETLSSNNVERNPLLGNGTKTLFVNNIVHGYHDLEGLQYSQQDAYLSYGPILTTAVGNVFRSNSFTCGTQSYAFSYLVATQGAELGHKIYRSDNSLDTGTCSVTPIEEYGKTGGLPALGYDPNVASAVLAGVSMPAGYTPLAASSVLATVMPRIGARPNDRDSVDTRIASEVTARTSRFVVTQADVGGWPTLATNGPTAIAIPANPHAVGSCGASRTSLECYLISLSDALVP